MADTPLDYNALMQANLTQVFGERDASRRLKAIAQIYAPEATLYEPEAEAKGHVAINEAVEALLSHLPPTSPFPQSAPRLVTTDLDGCAGNRGPRTVPWP